MFFVRRLLLYDENMNYQYGKNYDDKNVNDRGTETNLMLELIKADF